MSGSAQASAILSLGVSDRGNVRSDIIAQSPMGKEFEPRQLLQQIFQTRYRCTKILPIMHTVVIREDVYREYPWVAASLYEAFRQARDIAVDGLYDTDALRLALPFLLDHVEETWRVFGEDFWSYGLEANRPTLAAIGRYVHEHGLSPRVVEANELSAPGLT